MDKLDHRCQRIQFLVIITDRLTRQNRHNRTQAFAARADDICTDLRNQCDIGLHRTVDDFIDFGKVFRQMSLEIGQILEHGRLSGLRFRQTADTA